MMLCVAWSDLPLCYPQLDLSVGVLLAATVSICHTPGGNCQLDDTFAKWEGSMESIVACLGISPPRPDVIRSLSRYPFSVDPQIEPQHITDACCLNREVLCLNAERSRRLRVPFMGGRSGRVA